MALNRDSVKRWAPAVFAVVFLAAVLLRAGTSPLDLLRYAAYVCLGVMMPGTLVYRSLRKSPHSLVDDLAMGAAVGLVLELGAWAVFSALDLRGAVWIWPALVAAVFAGVPRLRRHWLVQGNKKAPLGWSWTITGVVCAFTAYLATVFLQRNPILPRSEGTLQYLDLPYQLSLAGEAKHHFPLDLPQVAGEPLHYHWFAYAHMAMTSMVGQIDLPVVALRLAVPALCALAILLTGVVAWRITDRPMVGAIAAVLFFAVGEFNFTDPVTMPFGTQVTFVIWHGVSMIYSWVVLIALIGVLASIVDGRSGRGTFVLATVLLLASSGAKASSLPVVAAALAFTAVISFAVRRRIPWGVVIAGLLTGAAQLFATAVLYRFQTYGLEVGPLQGLEPYWATSAAAPHWLVVAGVWIAFALSMLLRTAGIVPLLWQRRLRLEPVQCFLLGGAIAGPAIYLLVSQPSSANQYFLRSGFTFAVILSAWGYHEVLERARLSRAELHGLGAAAVAFAAVLTTIQLVYAGSQPSGSSIAPLIPLLRWAMLLALFGLLAGLLWRVARRWKPALRGRGGLVLLTAILAAGAPGLVMDAHKSARATNGGAYDVVALPRSRVDAARWVRDHSDPDDVIATNVHCAAQDAARCDPRSFWLSAYSERSVLVEGWGFAPRVATHALPDFWDLDLLRANDRAFTDPTPDDLDVLRRQHGVRWLVADRQVGPLSSALDTLATKVYDNGRIVVYQL